MPGKTLRFEWALDANEHLVHIMDAQRGLLYRCPLLGCPSPRIVAHKGQIKAHHFQHYTNACCAWAGESVVHQRAKAMIYEYYKRLGAEVHMERTTDSRVSDVFVEVTPYANRKWVFEIQTSSTTAEDIIERSKDHHRAGIERTFWIGIGRSWSTARKGTVAKVLRESYGDDATFDFIGLAVLPDSFHAIAPRPVLELVDGEKILKALMKRFGQSPQDKILDIPATRELLDRLPSLSDLHVLPHGRLEWLTTNHAQTLSKADWETVFATINSELQQCRDNERALQVERARALSTKRGARLSEIMHRLTDEDPHQVFRNVTKKLEALEEKGLVLPNPWGIKASEAEWAALCLCVVQATFRRAKSVHEFSISATTLRSRIAGFFETNDTDPFQELPASTRFLNWMADGNVLRSDRRFYMISPGIESPMSALFSNLGEKEISDWNENWKNGQQERRPRR